MLPQPATRTRSRVMRVVSTLLLCRDSSSQAASLRRNQTERPSRVAAVARAALGCDDWVMRPILHLAAGLLACILGGCSFLSLEHMYGIGEGGPTPPSHPWHEWPAKIGMAALGFPLLVVFSPLIAVEALTDSGSVLREGRPGISTYIIAPPAIAAGYLVGLPFLV